MKIIVCIKQVPSSNEVRLDPVRKTIIRDSSKAVTNPFDVTAAEAAVRIKERFGGTVTAVSMGIPATERLLRDEIARGVDEAVLLTDRAFAGADTLATSYTLSCAIRTLSADLILCGKMATDGDTAQIGPELAQRLGIPHVSDVTEILEAAQDHLVVRRRWDNLEQELLLPLPALITVDKGTNPTDLPTIPGMLRGRAAQIPLYDAETLEADRSRSGLKGSPTQVVKTYTPPMRGQAEEICGSPEEKAQAVARICKEVLYGAN